MDSADSLDNINEIIDDPRFNGVLNSSGWPMTKCIKLSTKSEFLQCLIFNEVVQKRQLAVQSFCKGLDHLNVHKLLKQHKDVLRPAFLYDHQATLTSDTFIDLISTPRPSHEISAKIYDWFVEYIRESHTREASLQQILLFCTGLKKIPPMGLKERITIKFLTISQLPMAHACFSVIELPTVHTNKSQFFHKMDQGILYSLNHFGQI